MRLGHAGDTGRAVAARAARQAVTSQASTRRRVTGQAWPRKSTWVGTASAGTGANEVARDAALSRATGRRCTSAIDSAGRMIESRDASAPKRGSAARQCDHFDVPQRGQARHEPGQCCNTMRHAQLHRESCRTRRLHEPLHVGRERVDGGRQLRRRKRDAMVSLPKVISTSASPVHGQRGHPPRQQVVQALFRCALVQGIERVCRTNSAATAAASACWKAAAPAPRSNS